MRQLWMPMVETSIAKQDRVTSKVSDSLNKVSTSMPQLARELRRLGKNVNGYFGETIDIASVLADCATAAREHGWSIEEIHSAPRLILGLTRGVSAHAIRSVEQTS